jgi:hypothetical protein
MPEDRQRQAFTPRLDWDDSYLPNMLVSSARLSRIEIGAAK